MRNRRTVWSIPNEPFRGGHPAAFPKALVEPMVLSSCPEGGVCLDPFAGTGTVGLVALAHGRKAILIEASAEYCGIAAKHRIETEIRPYKAELEKRRQQKRSNVPHAPRVRKIVQPEA
jgi:DNA modification methylase